LEWATLCGFAGLTLPSLALAACLVAAGVAALLGQHLAALGVLTLGMALSWRLGGAWLAWGVPYIGLPLLAMSWLRDRPLPGPAGSDAVGRADVLFVVLVVWASDIGAYVAGRLIGGPKLAPAISPGKTRSGALGGLVAAMAVGAAAAHGLGLGSPGRAAVIAGVLAVASQVGDLFESWVKRRFGVKDSGWLIPGHGGLFDRMDGLLAAAPTAAALAILAGRGGVLWN
jgi:phosphatidate cytidylyltransferase